MPVRGLPEIRMAAPRPRGHGQPLPPGLGNAARQPGRRYAMAAVNFRHPLQSAARRTRPSLPRSLQGAARCGGRGARTGLRLHSSQPCTRELGRYRRAGRLSILELLASVPPQATPRIHAMRHRPVRGWWLAGHSGRLAQLFRLPGMAGRGGSERQIKGLRQSEPGLGGRRPRFQKNPRAGTSASRRNSRLGEHRLPRNPRKTAAWKVALAADLKRITQARNAWLARHLHMGRAEAVSSHVSQFQRRQSK
jgi:hypothetical protein